MISIPLLEASVAIGGRPTKPISPLDYVTKFTEVSQEVVPGTLFVAIIGEQNDGHDFLRDVQEKGAIGAVVEKQIKDVDLPQFIVPSPVEALGQLGKIWRGRLNIPLVAVTGSVGKTSTKDMIAHILKIKFNLHKGRGNFNSKRGIPKELSLLNRSHNCSVVEFGMSEKNQINYLSKIARPTIGVITNIGISHIENLESQDNIATAKLEIIEGIDKEGCVVLYSDDKYYKFLKDASKRSCKVISFGESPESDYRISNIQLTPSGNPTFIINAVPIEIKDSIGMHHAYNAGAAFAVASILGVRSEDIASQLYTYKAPEGRGDMLKAECGARLIDNTYNAAPDSIRASLSTLAVTKTRGARTVAVIGEMLELGDFSKEAHKSIGATILEKGIDFIVTVGGKNAKFIAQGFGRSMKEKWRHFDNANVAADFLLGEITKNDVILLQGSRGMSLDIVVKTLIQGSMVYL